MEYKSGPKIEPWGTPYDIVALEERSLLTEIHWVLFFKYDSNQSRTQPEIPKVMLRLSKV